MATTTKKTTTKAKTTVEAKTEDIVENVENNVEEKITEKPVIVKEKKVFTDSDYILCRSVWAGGLNVISQSGNLYEFKDYGSEPRLIIVTKSL